MEKKKTKTKTESNCSVLTKDNCEEANSLYTKCLRKRMSVNSNGFVYKFNKIYM